MSIRGAVNRISSAMTQALPHSRSPSPKTAKLQEPPAKKTKVEGIPFEEVDYANGLHLAPMVRSGACGWLLLDAPHPISQRCSANTTHQPRIRREAGVDA